MSDAPKNVGVERLEMAGVKFDNTINLGHILTFLGFLVAQGEIDANPAVGIPAPRRADR